MDVENDESSLSKICSCNYGKSYGFMIMCDGCRTWYHEKCVNITKKQAKDIDKYYCPFCTDSNKAVDNVDKDVKQPDENDDYVPEDIDCDLEDKDDEDFQLSTTKKVNKEKRRYRKNLSKIKKNSEEKIPKKRGRKKGSSKTTKENRGIGGRRKYVRKSSSLNRTKSHSDESSDETKISPPRQCYGPGCVNVARKGSKYCSDECGLALAEKRMSLIIPDRIKTWKSVPIAADERARKELEEIQQELTKVFEKLDSIDRERNELEKLIEKGKNCLPIEETENEEIDKTESETVNCGICNAEVSIKKIMKHKERCFNKIESRTCFETKNKFTLEKQIFCNHFNEKTSGYCLRLRQMCTEHNKEQSKISDTEVCGHPLKNDPFTDNGNNFCRILKKECHFHHGWEKVRRAVKDIETLQQYQKVENLNGRQKAIRLLMSQRGSLMALLLNKTKYENIDNKNKKNAPMEID